MTRRKKPLDEFERLMKTFPSTRAVKVSEGRTYTGTFFITSFRPKAKPACKLVAALYVSLHSAVSCQFRETASNNGDAALQTKMTTEQALYQLVKMMQVVSFFFFL